MQAMGKYRVVGRYMDGHKVIGYHLMCPDGSQMRVTKGRAIALITEGKIENMRIQTDSSSEYGGIIIRGNGVNLNTLPVYNEKSGEYNSRSSTISGAANKNTSENPMGQLEVVGKIMREKSLMGYCIKDASGAISKMHKADVLKLALQKRVSNVAVQRLTKDGVTNYILRGVGCNLKEIPIIRIDSVGKILDPSKNVSGIKLRATKLIRSGILYNNRTNSKMNFESGDYIICGINGDLIIDKADNIYGKYNSRVVDRSADCDSCLDNLKDYSIEFYGNKPIKISKQQVLKWAVIRVR